MKNKCLFLAILLSCLSTNLFSQEKEAIKLSDNPNHLSENWYIEIGVGGQMLFAKDADRLDFGNRITPAITLTGGKWFSPFWGVRVQAMGYGLNGYSTTEGIYIADPLSNGLIYGPNDPTRNKVSIYPDGSYHRDLRYMNLHADFQVSLFNMIFGYNTNKKINKWDIVPAVGIGYMRTFDYKSTQGDNFISTNFSLMGKYKFDRFDINLELQTALLPDQFDGRITGSRCENNMALTIGATYRIGKQGFKKRSVEVPKEVLLTVRDTVVVTKEVKKEVEKTIPNTPFTLTAIRFNIDNTQPIKDQDISYNNIVSYLEKNPQSKIRLDGYADKETGSPDYNLQLSFKRAISVQTILINDYGVNKNRIEVQGIGVNAQPYGKSKFNRVVNVVAIE